MNESPGNITELKESLLQKWQQDSYRKIFKDQFGFEIKYGDPGKTEYCLRYRGHTVITTYSLVAAKLISTIILNDKIMNSP